MRGKVGRSTSPDASGEMVRFFGHNSDPISSTPRAVPAARPVRTQRHSSDHMR